MVLIPLVANQHIIGNPFTLENVGFTRFRAKDRSQIADTRRR